MLKKFQHDRGIAKLLILGYELWSSPPPRIDIFKNFDNITPIISPPPNLFPQGEKG
jgi:hypothetical protein